MSDGDPTVDQLQAQLDEISQIVRAYAEVSNEGICFTHDGIILDANEPFAEMFGYAREDLIGTSALDLATPETRQTVAHAIQSGRTDPYEADGLRSDGAVFNGRLRGCNVTYRGKHARVTVVLDVSAEKQAEHRLRHELQRFEDAADNALQWFWETDAHGRFTYASAAVEGILGYTPEEMVGRAFHELLRREDRAAIRKAALGFFKRKEAFQRFENPNLHRDGRVVWLSTSGVPIVADDGSLLGFRGTDIDITRRKLFEQELGAKEAEYEALFEASRDAIFWADPQTGELVRCNAAAERLVERPRDEIVGMHQIRLHPPGETEHYAEIFRRHSFQDGPMEGEAEVVTSSGERRPVWIAATVAPVASRTLVQGVFHDLTERRRAEEERARLEASMQQAQKLESLGLLAGGIAHDFNNLLMGMLGNAGLALMKMTPETAGRREIEQIEVAARRAAELTAQMLAYSGKGRFLVEPLDLSSLVREMTGLLQTAISKRARLSLHLDDDLPRIKGDGAQVRQVVMNLITNASDALGDDGGLIRVAATLVDADRTYLAETWLDDDLPEGPYVQLEVVDDGCGMDPDTRAQMFDPFFSTKVTGRGLGLAAVLGIVRGHRGALRVYSEPDHGTTIRVLLPLAEALAEPHVARPVQADDWRGSGLVLVVDDEAMVRDTARLMLEALGFDVLLAVDGEEGIARYRDRADDIQVVVLDLTMPNLPGDLAFAELRRIRPDVRVVLSSGYSEQDATDRFAGKGLAGFIQKPYSPRSLAEVLRGVLEST